MGFTKLLMFSAICALTLASKEGDENRPIHKLNAPQGASQQQRKAPPGETDEIKGKSPKDDDKTVGEKTGEIVDDVFSGLDESAQKISKDGYITIFGWECPTGWFIFGCLALIGLIVLACCCMCCCGCINCC